MGIWCTELEGPVLAGVGPEATRRSRRRVHWSGTRSLFRVTATGSQAHWMAALRGDLAEAVNRAGRHSGDAPEGVPSVVRLSALAVLIAGAVAAGRLLNPSLNPLGDLPGWVNRAGSAAPLLFVVWFLALNTVGCTSPGARSGGWSRVWSHHWGDDRTRRHDDHRVRAVPPRATRRRRARSAAARFRAGAREPTARAARRDARGERATPALALQRIQYVGRAHFAEAGRLHDRHGHRLRPKGPGLVGPRRASFLASSASCDPRLLGEPRDADRRRETVEWWVADIKLLLLNLLDDSDSGVVAHAGSPPHQTMTT